MIVCIIGLCIIGFTLICLGLSIFFSAMHNHYELYDNKYWTELRKGGEPDDDLMKLKKKHDRFENLDNYHGIGDCGSLEVPFWLGAILSIIFILFAGGFLIDGRCPRSVDKKYQEAMIEREALVYRLDHKDELIIGNEVLYKDITTFNQKINNYKLDRDNPWINWFIDPKLASIEPIEYKAN